MKRPTQRLITTLGLGWLAFLGLGLGLRQALSGPSVVVIIDHSFCPAPDWSRVTQTYGDLYQQNQNRQITIERVILVSGLGEAEILESPPNPETISNLRTFGESNATAIADVTNQYPEARVLTCDSP